VCTETCPLGTAVVPIVVPIVVCEVVVGGIVLLVLALTATVPRTTIKLKMAMY